MVVPDVLEFDLGQAILSVYSADGFLGIGVDVPGQETAGTSTFDARFPYGTFGRPRDPDVSTDGTRRTGAITLFGYAGTARHAWVLDDPRVTPKLPEAPLGTWGAYADTGREEIPVMVLDGTTGSWAVRVPHAPYTGTASGVRIDVENQGAEEIVLAHGAGPMLKVTPTSVEVHPELRVGSAPFQVPAMKASPSLVAFIDAVTTYINGVAPGTIVPPTNYTSSNTFIG